MREIGHFIGGKEVAGQSHRFGDVFNPNTGEVQARVAVLGEMQVRWHRGSAATPRLR